MKTSELTGAALDWAVAKCEGRTIHIFHKTVHVDNRVDWGLYAPSTNWAQGGPIIEREYIELKRGSAGAGLYWVASIDLDEGDVMIEEQSGHSSLIAAMRCYVASKLGDEIEIPEELT